MSEFEQTGTNPQSASSSISELSKLLGKCSQELFYAIQDNESLSSRLSLAVEENAALSQKFQAAEIEAERLRSIAKSEIVNDAMRRELQFMVMTMQISLAQARADLAEVRTDLDLNLKSSQFNSEGSGDFLKRKILDSDPRSYSSPLSVTDFGDASSFSKSKLSEPSASRLGQDDSVQSKSQKEPETGDGSRASKSAMRLENMKDELAVASFITKPAGKTDSQVFHFSKLGMKDESLSYEGKVPISLSGLLAEKERPAVIEFKGNADSDSSELEKIRRRKAERLSHPPSAKALAKALSAVQSRPSQQTDQTSAGRQDLDNLPRKSHAGYEDSSDLGASSPLASAEERRAVARSNSGNHSFDDSINFTGGADLEQIKLARKHRRLEDSGSVQSPSPTSAVTSSKSRRGDGKTAGVDRGEERVSESLGMGKAQNGSGDGYSGKGPSSGELASSADRRGPFERTAPAASAPRHKPAGHGVDPMAAVSARTSAPVTQACTQRFVGRVTAECRGSLFMESSVGTTDIFIPAPLCKTRSSPVQVGDTVAVEAFECLVNGNRWKVLRILTPDGGTEDAGKGRRPGSGDSGGTLVKESSALGKESGQVVRNLTVEVRNCETSPWAGQLSTDRYVEGGGVSWAGKGGRGPRARQDADKSVRDEAADSRDRLGGGGKGTCSTPRSTSWEEGPVGTIPPANDAGGRRVVCKTGPPAPGGGKPKYG